MATETKVLIDAIYYIDQAIGSLSILQNMIEKRGYQEKIAGMYKIGDIVWKAQNQLEKQARRLENKAIRRRLL